MAKTRRPYARDFREKMVALVRSGRSPAELSKEFEPTPEGRQHPDRDAQFRRIDRRVRAFQRLGQPVVSVDTKKKELVGAYRNVGREWRPKGRPEEARVHDFIDRELGKAIPHGVYDLAADAGWVSVGVDHDTAEFAVETLRR